jgi:hypothetical protein
MREAKVTFQRIVQPKEKKKQKGCYKYSTNLHSLCSSHPWPPEHRINEGKGKR